MKQLLRYTFLSMFLIALCSCTVTEKNRQFSEGVSGIQGSYWMLVSLKGQDVPDVPSTSTAYIRFEEASDEVKGYGGCNRLTGRYELNNSSLRLTNLATTRMMCPDIEQENFLIAILEHVDSFRIAGDVLTLFNNKEAVATFQAGNDPDRLDGR
ncbi:META domain-containing protein [Pontibacter roseus]|uniref:META domain-containing protein n=1 Tax=Pontibacter roseus TaxID=336989 RepID=UPI00038098BB|nr:META domain-containing protein [Pontibacter roseus]